VDGTGRARRASRTPPAPPGRQNASAQAPAAPGRKAPAQLGAQFASPRPRRKHQANGYDKMTGTHRPQPGARGVLLHRVCGVADALERLDGHEAR